MAEESEKKESQESLTMYYIIGALIVAAIAAGVYFFRPQQTATQEAGVTTQPQPLPTRPTGPIVGLACEYQYYNPVVGFPRYYLSAEGADVAETKEVTCEFTVTVAGREVAKETATEDTFSDADNRGGKTFRCSTQAVTLEKNVPTKVDVTMTNDKKETASCSSTFSLP